MKKFFTWKTALVVLGILVAIQFIRPARNEAESNGVDKNALSLDDNTYKILETACFDCHSNKSNYKWYADIMPIGWLIKHDIEEGKEHLNFAEWQTYDPEKRAHKLVEILEEVQEGEMPMKLYLLTHAEARITDVQYQQLETWVSKQK